MVSTLFGTKMPFPSSLDVVFFFFFKKGWVTFSLFDPFFSYRNWRPSDRFEMTRVFWYDEKIGGGGLAFFFN